MHMDFGMRGASNRHCIQLEAYSIVRGSPGGMSICQLRTLYATSTKSEWPLFRVFGTAQSTDVSYHSAAITDIISD
jgi:hypothetical protein